MPFSICDAVPALDGAVSVLGRGVTSSLHADNIAALAVLDGEGIGTDDPIAALLIDPQTAGGLLAGVPAERAEDCLARLCELGYRAALIGRVEQMRGDAPRVRVVAGAAEIPAELVAVP